MTQHLVLVGGGHAHLTVLVNLQEFVRRGHQVTLISSSAYHYYSGMGPGMLGGVYTPEEIRFHIKGIAESRKARFVEARVERVDPVERKVFLSTGDSISYDVISFNTGSYIPMEQLGYSRDSIYTVKPIEMLLKGQQHLRSLLAQKNPSVVVIGGGPAGLEITGNVWRLAHDSGGRADITMVAGRKLLGRFPEKVGDLARASLMSRGIDVVENSHVEKLEQGRALLTDGRTIHWDCCFIALGIKPSPLFKKSGITTGSDGGLLVNEFLQSVNYPEIFGGGDCISFKARPLDKVGVYAVRQNPILYHNLLAALEGRALTPFIPQETYLLLFNLGNGRAIYWRNNSVREGRLLFWLKNYIDKKFIKKFQTA